MSNIKDDDDFIDKLIHVIKSNSIKQVEDIINNYSNAQNVDINKLNKDGNTTFMLAAQYSTNVEIIQYLRNTFKDMIDLNKQDNNGRNTLMLTVKYNTNVEFIQYLCSNTLQHTIDIKK